MPPFPKIYITDVLICLSSIFTIPILYITLSNIYVLYSGINCGLIYNTWFYSWLLVYFTNIAVMSSCIKDFIWFIHYVIFYNIFIRDTKYDNNKYTNYDMNTTHNYKKIEHIHDLIYMFFMSVNSFIFFHNTSIGCT